MDELMKEQTRGLIEALESDSDFHGKVAETAACLKEAFERGNHLYTAGNGGSAAEAQHLAEELLGRYRSNRVSYPAVALTADGTALTCIANDFGYEEVFKRQLEGLGRKGDVFIALSTSGNSENLVRAAAYARSIGMTVVSFTGLTGKLADLADIAVRAPSPHAARVQELHLHAIHLICEMFEA